MTLSGSQQYLNDIHFVNDGRILLPLLFYVYLRLDCLQNRTLRVTKEVRNATSKMNLCGGNNSLTSRKPKLFLTSYGQLFSRCNHDLSSKLETLLVNEVLFFTQNPM